MRECSERIETFNFHINNKNKKKMKQVLWDIIQNYRFLLTPMRW